MKHVAQSPDEIFDVVDGQDCVIGQATRSEVHARHLLHRAVHVFWVRADGLLCLQRRSYAKDSCPGLLSSSCAGHLDAGEPYVAAAVRELNEELGIALPSGDLRQVDACPAHPDLGHEFVRVYLLEGDHPVKIATREIDALLWRTPAEVDAWIRHEPSAFSTSLIHLLERKAVREALRLAPSVGG